jgi:beta-galactosidase
MTDFVHSLDDTRPVTAGVNVLLNVYTNLGMGVYRDKGNYKPDPLPEGKKYKEKKTGSAFFNALTQKLGKLMFFMSSGRPGDMASKGAADGLDILGLNYASSRYDYDAKKYPDRLMVGAETMAQDLPYNWERVKKYPQLIGDFVWSAWDYLGETCMGWTYHSYKGLPLLANQGMIDITGKPLASMGFMQVVWGLRDKPYIAVRPLNHADEKPSKGSWQFTDAIDSWNWKGYDGTMATVEVYSQGEAVRLSLNEKEIGKRCLKDFKAIFKLPYADGELKAEALDKNEKVISTHSLFSGDTQLKLNVRPEKNQLSVGELCYIPIEFSDSRGLLRPDIERRVDISVEGGKLLGFGSALYKTDDSFNNGHYNSYRGRCLAVVQATDEGLIDIKIKSAGVDPANITLEVK